MSTNPVALITGANRGIGFALARRLGEQHFTVWLGCRDETRGETAAAELRAAGLDARAVAVDVTSDESVRSAAARTEQESGSLDVLVNNAGMHFGLPPGVSEEKISDMQAMFETNALGPVRVTQAFLPLLRRSAAARIVMVTSGLGSHALTTDLTSENWGVGFAGYCASKSALNMFTLKFAKELLADNIKVNVVDPGLTRTELGGSPTAQPPEGGARALVTLATMDHTLAPTGGFFHAGPTGELARHPW